MTLATQTKPVMSLVALTILAGFILRQINLDTNWIVNTTDTFSTSDVVMELLTLVLFLQMWKLELAAEYFGILMTMILQTWENGLKDSTTIVVLTTALTLPITTDADEVYGAHLYRLTFIILH